ncbi:LOW QUALITY PROTEIN: hypothetical protein Cgig2_000344 [Carnegiea gigantea]|uniref:Uncharacterized protein n=1 Tax=Carnegiea gigantea TaxID=171969 RepID=A0A9Q1KCY9_9CARY|nr:LOW QUALITY PROTEIN: hypothetical protein Cgig2_000344 [Carnegiea gigantea]
MVAETGDLGRTTMVVPLGPMPTSTIAQATDAHQPLPLRPMQHTFDEPLGSRSKNKPRALREEPLIGNKLLSAVRAVSAPGVSLFHEQNGHTIAECRELRKALHELEAKGQIDRLLKRAYGSCKRIVSPHCLNHEMRSFGDKGAKNIEVDFLVMDVSVADNIILRWPILHKVKAIIAPYLLQL